MTEKRALASLAVGESASVADLTLPRRIACRLMEMGLVPGTPVRVTRRAPLGDPIEVALRGSGLSLRQKEAELILVQAVRAKPAV